MRREIGSEFWEVPTAGENHLFPDETRWFLSGRSALEAILRENRFRTALLPEWCCDSMIRPFLEAGIAVSFYPTWEGPGDREADAVLVLDYFGYTGHSRADNFRGKVIRDVTHSLFSAVYEDADYCFGSLRKWAGFYTGGFAWGFRESAATAFCESGYAALRQQAMEEKAAYIQEKSDSKEYLSLFSQAEDLLEQPGVFAAADRDVELAKQLDVSGIRRRRRENAAILLDAVREIALFPDLKDSDCPLFVPILTDHRDELRRHLIRQEIYCPVHWPKTPLHQLTADGERLYDRELSLVCDQRYTPEDMHRVVRAIREFFEKGV